MGGFLLLIFFLNSLGKTPALLGGSAPEQLGISQFQDYLGDTASATYDPTTNQVKTAEWQNDKIRGELKSGKKYELNAVTSESQAGASLLDQMKKAKVDVKIQDPPPGLAILQIAGMFLMPLLLIGFFWFMMMRSSQGGGAQAMNFGRSKAKRAGENTPKITFEDVAGVDEAKEELFEVVDFLRNTKKYVALGAKIPKGILLEGPPGVGKTHLARAIAGEAGVPFFHISGSDFVEMFVGVGAARVRDLFETAKAHRPCLIFIDEIDAVGRQRGAGMGGGHDEREQTLNQLLVEMDGFEVNNGVIMIAATNRPDVLDPALLRPGRFDRRITVEAPDVTGRELILKIHAKGKPIAPEVNLGTIAKRTPGFSGADLANSLNEAALLAARRNHAKITSSDLEDALDRTLMGPARRGRAMDLEERTITAYHEAGHAILGEVLEHSDPIHKVTILPRGMSLGSTWQLPENDSYHTSRQELLDRICVLLGGLLAEEIVYGELWSGASSDLERVSRIARAMVTRLGMSEKIGSRAVGKSSSNPFLGREYGEDRDYSESMAELIDSEIKHIVDTCRQRAKDLLIQNREKLDALKDALLERETLDREDFLKVMNGEELPPLEATAPAVPPVTDSNSTEEGESENKKSSPPSQKLEPGTA